METNDTIKLPANCTALTSPEQREATGGASAETVVRRGDGGPGQRTAPAGTGPAGTGSPGRPQVNP